MSDDPRARLSAAFDQVQRGLDALGPGNTARPTPCAQFDLRTLAAHVVAVIRRLTTLGRGGSMLDVSDGW